MSENQPLMSVKRPNSEVLSSKGLDTMTDMTDVSDMKDGTLSGTQVNLQSLQIGGRVTWHGKDPLFKKLKGKDLTVKAFSPDPNYVGVSCPDWSDQTVAIADLRLAK